MREIKFRAWDMESKIMWDWDEMQEWWEEAGYSDNMLRGDHYVPMQYTGLKDRNGKEIYEGDIIQIPDDYEMYGMACGEKYEVDFKNGRFRLRPKYRPDALGYDLEGVEECEVLGNKYENPELLEVIE